MRRLLKGGLNPEVSNLSEHFKQRLQERRIKFTDVKESLKNPRLSFQNGGATVFVGVKVTVVVGENGNLVTAYKNRKYVYRGSKKKDIRRGRKQIDDRQDKGIPGIGFGLDGEEG